MQWHTEVSGDGLPCQQHVGERVWVLHFKQKYPHADHKKRLMLASASGDLKGFWLVGISIKCREMVFACVFKLLFNIICLERGSKEDLLA